MNAKEIREKTNEELLKEIDALKDELFNPVSYTHLTLPTKLEV